MLRRSTLLFLAFLLTACGALPSPTPALLPTATAAPPTATAAFTPTVGPTVTPLIGFAPATPSEVPAIELSSVPSPTVSPTPLVTAQPSVQASVGRYELFEADFNYTSGLYENPYEDATLNVNFTTPSGEQIAVGGFYYSPDIWRVRFVPAEIGLYSWTSDFVDAFGTRTDAGTLEVVESEASGFVRPAEDNRFRWVFDDGTPYYPIGLQDCLNDRDNSGDPFDDLGLDGGLRTDPADIGTRVTLIRYLDTYAGAGFNLWRWGAETCGFKLWDEIDPEGNEYIRQNGRFGDQLMIALRNRGFRVYANVFAFEPPFPQDTADGPKMNAVLRYVRYFVNRYAAYVDYWELMNEATASDEWMNLVASAVRQADPYDHPIATSFERPDLVLIDINSPHWYETEDESTTDVVTAERIRDLRRWGKPIIFGEQGNALVNWDPRSATRLRLRAWTAFFEEATLIFWNLSSATDYVSDRAARIYLGPEERGYIRALQSFTAGFDPAAEPVEARTSAPGIVRAYALRSSQMFAAYLVNGADHSSPTSGINLNFNSPGGTAVWYDPSTGNVLASLDVTAGEHTLTAPPFITDVALKVSSEE